MPTPAQQAKTAFRLRSDRFESLEVAAAADWDAGDLVTVEDTHGIVVQDAATGATAVVVYYCPKVLVPKQTGTGRTLAVGEKVFMEAAENRVSDEAGGGSVLVGRALEAAGTDDDTVLVHWDGTLTQPAAG